MIRIERFFFYRRPGWFTAGLLLLCSLANAQSTSPAKGSESPAPGGGSIVALFQDGPEGVAELSRTPLLAIYDDGRIIVRRIENENRVPITPSYWSGNLTVDQRIELNEYQAAVLRDPALRDDYELPTRSDRPTTTFVFTSGNHALAVKAHGLFAGEYAFEEDISGQDLLPAALVAYHRFLVSLLFDSIPLEPWQPEAYVARLFRVSRGGRVVTWPMAWPLPKNSPLQANPYDVEIVVPVRSREQFWAEIPGGRSGCVVVLDGNAWEVECFPYYPGHPTWFASIVGSDEWWGEPTSLCGCDDRLFFSPKRRLWAPVRAYPGMPKSAVTFLAPSLPFPPSPLPQILFPKSSARDRSDTAKEPLKLR